MLYSPSRRNSKLRTVMLSRPPRSFFARASSSRSDRNLPANPSIDLSRVTSTDSSALAPNWVRPGGNGNCCAHRGVRTAKTVIATLMQTNTQQCPARRQQSLNSDEFLGEFQAGFEVLPLLAAGRLLVGRPRRRLTRLTTLGDLSKSLELPGRNGPIGLPEFRIAVGEDARRRHDRFERQGPPWTELGVLLHVSLNVHVAFAHPHPRHRGAFRHQPYRAVAHVAGQ